MLLPSERVLDQFFWHIDTSLTASALIFACTWASVCARKLPLGAPKWYSTRLPRSTTSDCDRGRPTQTLRRLPIQTNVFSLCTLAARGSTETSTISCTVFQLLSAPHGRTAQLCRWSTFTNMQSNSARTKLQAVLLFGVV